MLFEAQSADSNEEGSRMEIDLPDVVAEVTAAFDRYEKALVTNDVAVLDDTFRADPRTIRYGTARNPLRPRRDRGVSRGALAGRPRAHHVEDRHHHLWPRLRRRLDAVSSRHHARQGRPADAELGEISRRLARGRGACQRDRREGCLEASVRTEHDVRSIPASSGPGGSRARSGATTQARCWRRLRAGRRWGWSCFRPTDA